MDRTRIVLVRHGESMAQQRQIIGGHAGCTGLSDLGRRQGRLLAKRLAETGELSGTTVLYASIMPRAVETASIIAESLGSLDVVQDCDFCEHHPGEGDGLSYEEFDHRWPVKGSWNPELRRDPGGETWSEMATRVARGLDAVAERHQGETIVIACHGGVVVHSMIRWLNLGPGGSADRAWMNPINTSITEWRLGPSPFRWIGSEIELVRFNDHAHLAALND